MGRAICTVAIAEALGAACRSTVDPPRPAIPGALHDEGCLRGLDHDTFVGRLAYYLGEVNALHPFRDGNGRRSGPSSGSSPATPGSRSPGSTSIPCATSRLPLRSCAATRNRCARCSARSSGMAPDQARSAHVEGHGSGCSRESSVVRADFQPGTRVFVPVKGAPWPSTAGLPPPDSRTTGLRLNQPWFAGPTRNLCRRPGSQIRQREQVTPRGDSVDRGWLGYEPSSPGARALESK